MWSSYLFGGNFEKFVDELADEVRRQLNGMIGGVEILFKFEDGSDIKHVIHSETELTRIAEGYKSIGEAVGPKLIDFTVDKPIYSIEDLARQVDQQIDNYFYNSYMNP